jgi:hypothetical protein
VFLGVVCGTEGPARGVCNGLILHIGFAEDEFEVGLVAGLERYRRCWGRHCVRGWVGERYYKCGCVVGFVYRTWRMYVVVDDDTRLEL